MDNVNKPVIIELGPVANLIQTDKIKNVISLENSIDCIEEQSNILDSRKLLNAFIELLRAEDDHMRYEKLQAGWETHLHFERFIRSKLEPHYQYVVKNQSKLEEIQIVKLNAYLKSIISVVDLSRQLSEISEALSLVCTSRLTTSIYDQYRPHVGHSATPQNECLFMKPRNEAEFDEFTKQSINSYHATVIEELKKKASVNDIKNNYVEQANLLMKSVCVLYELRTDYAPVQNDFELPNESLSSSNMNMIDFLFSLNDIVPIDDDRMREAIVHFLNAERTHLANKLDLMVESLLFINDADPNCVTMKIHSTLLDRNLTYPLFTALSKVGRLDALICRLVKFIEKAVALIFVHNGTIEFTDDFQQTPDIIKDFLTDKIKKGEESSSIARYVFTIKVTAASLSKSHNRHYANAVARLIEHFYMLIGGASLLVDGQSFVNLMALIGKRLHYSPQLYLLQATMHILHLHHGQFDIFVAQVIDQCYKHELRWRQMRFLSNEWPLLFTGGLGTLHGYYEINRMKELLLVSADARRLIQPELPEIDIAAEVEELYDQAKAAFTDDTSADNSDDVTLIGDYSAYDRLSNLTHAVPLAEIEGYEKCFKDCSFDLLPSDQNDEVTSLSFALSKVFAMAEMQVSRSAQTMFLVMHRLAFNAAAKPIYEKSYFDMVTIGVELFLASLPQVKLIGFDKLPHKKEQPRLVFAQKTLSTFTADQLHQIGLAIDNCLLMARILASVALNYKHISMICQKHSDGNHETKNNDNSKRQFWNVHLIVLADRVQAASRHLLSTLQHGIKLFINKEVSDYKIYTQLENEECHAKLKNALLRTRVFIDDHLDVMRQVIPNVTYAALLRLALCHLLERVTQVPITQRQHLSLRRDRLPIGQAIRQLLVYTQSRLVKDSKLLTHYPDDLTAIRTQQQFSTEIMNILLSPDGCQRYESDDVRFTDYQVLEMIEELR